VHTNVNMLITTNTPPVFKKLAGISRRLLVIK
jgi:hypothetical protein